MATLRLLGKMGAVGWTFSLEDLLESKERFAAQSQRQFLPHQLRRWLRYPLQRPVKPFSDGSHSRGVASSVVPVLPQHRDFTRHIVNHGADQYVRQIEGMPAHTKTVEGFVSVLKHGITGCYFHAREAHLHRYLAEFDSR